MTPLPLERIVAEEMCALEDAFEPNELASLH